MTGCGDAPSPGSAVLHRKTARAVGIVALKHRAAYYVRGIPGSGIVRLKTDLEACDALKLAYVRPQTIGKRSVSLNQYHDAVVAWEAGDAADPWDKAVDQWRMAFEYLVELPLGMNVACFEGDARGPAVCPDQPIGHRVFRSAPPGCADRVHASMILLTGGR